MDRICAAGEPKVRPIVFSIEFPAGMRAPLMMDGTNAKIFDISGTTVSVSHIDAPAAGGNASVRIGITDGDGLAWAVLISADGVLDQWEAATRETLNKPVQLRLRYRRAFQLDSSVGFVLNDDSGLVLASEGGRNVDTLTAADTPTVTVAKGEAICRETTCRTFRMLSLHGTTNAEVGIDQDGQLTIVARQYRARNQGVRDIFECGDTEEASPWSLWRLPAP